MAADLPDGDVEIWVIVFADDGAFMGAGQVLHQPRWLWRDGKLGVDYSPVRVIVQHPGRYKTGLICAVSPGSQAYRPLWPVSLGTPQKMRAGDDITIADGIISVIPELPGPHG